MLEVFLISGTKPENLLTIIDQGLSINFSGAGIYFTEDAAKADQYATPDSQKGFRGHQFHSRLDCSKTRTSQCAPPHCGRNRILWKD
eukprot:6474352-Amphidinium_carterae.1